MSRTHVRVTVRLKPAILDPQGRSVQATLHRLGHDGAENVRIGKVIEFDRPGPPDAAAHDAVRRMAEEVLANPVLEDVEIELREAPAPDDTEPARDERLGA